MKTYTLLDRDGRPYRSRTPGALGGHRRTKVYGRLDCPTALRWIAKGHYVQHRVFFADEEVAVAAGYRPCGHCLRTEYRQWLAQQPTGNSPAGVALDPRARTDEVGSVKRVDSASIVLEAPADRVFAAFVDPVALEAWLPPEGMQGRFERADFRPGGGYRLVLSFLDPTTGRGKTTAGSDVVEARIVSVTEGREVLQEIDFVSDDPAYAGTMRMSWRATPVAGGTLAEIVAEDVPSGISPDAHAEGMGSSLQALADYLAHPPPAATAEH